MGLHSGPVSSAVRETDSSHFGLTPATPVTPTGPAASMSIHAAPTLSIPRLTPPTRKTRHTDSPVSTTGARTNPSHSRRLGRTLRTLRATDSTRCSEKRRPGREAASLAGIHTRTSLHAPAPFLQLQGRPLFLPCKQATSSPGLVEERPLVPGPGGRGRRSRRPNTEALSHPVTRGGPGPSCAEIHEARGFQRSASFQRCSPRPLHPRLLFLPNSLPPLLSPPSSCPCLFPPAFEEPFSHLPHDLPLQGALKRLALLPLLLGACILSLSNTHTLPRFWGSPGIPPPYPLSSVSLSSGTAVIF